VGLFQKVKGEVLWQVAGLLVEPVRMREEEVVASTPWVEDEKEFADSKLFAKSYRRGFLAGTETALLAWEAAREAERLGLTEFKQEPKYPTNHTRAYWEGYHKAWELVRAMDDGKYLKQFSKGETKVKVLRFDE
jgi:hypothetical protein